MRLVDLSHVIEAAMTTYPGLPGPVIGPHLTFDQSHAVYAAGTEFAIGRIEMVANTGTYLDTPAHRYRGGADLADLPLERCVDLPAVVVDADGAIGPAAFAAFPGFAGGAGSAEGADGVGTEVAGSAVLLRTGWDRHWRTDRYGDPVHPHLTEAGAHALVDAGVALVGIDSVNIDDTTTGHRPAHTVLLAAGVVVVEHLTALAALPVTGARFTAVPPAVRGLATFPVRAFAALP